MVLADAQGGVYVHHVTVRDRVSERLHADRWDQALASGVSPESCAPLALHARALVAPASRRGLAASLARILEDARGSGLPEWNALGPRHRHTHVLAVRVEIEALIRLLVAPAPVSGRGVALVRLLLTDGGGPLYRRSAATDLATEIARAARALDPVSDWTL